MQYSDMSFGGVSNLAAHYILDTLAQSSISESTAAKNATETCLAGKSAKLRHWTAFVFDSTSRLVD
jgi:hypothetical protein